jgi:hypothetical protein
MWQWLRRFLALGLFCLAFSVQAAPVWLNDATRLYLVDTLSQQITAVEAGATVRATTPTSDGGAYVLTTTQLLALDSRGGRRILAVPSLNIADIDLLAADPFDGTLWVVDSRGQIHHVDSEGAEAFGFAAAVSPRAIALAQDQSLWVLGNSRLLHYAPDGTLIQTLNLATWLTDGPAKLIVDSLNSGIWVGSGNQIWRIDLAHSDQAPIVRWTDTAIRGVALDPKQGIFWVLLDTVLQSFDKTGTSASRIDLSSLGVVKPAGVASDSTDASLWIGHANGVIHLSSSGTRLDTLSVPVSVAGVASAPFSVMPRIQLFSPVPDTDLNNSQPTITLGLDALCAGVPCGFSPDFVKNYTLSVTLDQQDISKKVRFDQTSGQATFTPSQALASGEHSLSAIAADAFGHSSNRITAKFGVSPMSGRQSGPSNGANVMQAQPQVMAPASKNQPPTATLSTNGTSFSSGASIVLSATASDPDGTVSKVNFYRGGTTLIGAGVLSSGVWTYTWASVPAGSYSLTAVATDNAGATGTSNAVSVNVVANNAPTVTISNPTNGAVFTAPAIGTIAATASDSDGTVATVDFYDGSVLLGTVTGNGTASLSASQAFSNLSLGAHTIKAVATDNQGATGTATVNVKVTSPPLVALAWPGGCTGYTAPANISLRADAFEPNGVITKVEFYQGKTLIGTATTPYPGEADYLVQGWNSVPAGTYTITATAYDSYGVTATSAPMTIIVSAPPTVSVTAPTAGATVKIGAPMTLQASASVSNGTVSRVDYWSGNLKLGSSTTSPYTVNWTPTSAYIGTFSFYAVATSNANLTSSSNTVSVNIISDVPPTISLSSPANNATYTTGSNITLSASATPGDYPIQRVEFYQGGNLLGSASASPYTYTWPNVAAGSYTFTAKAITQGSSTTSSPVSVSVVTPPPVAVTSPANNSSFTMPGAVNIAVNAYSASATIKSIKIYDGSTLVTTYTPSGAYNQVTYNYTWSTTTAGTHNLTAVVTDSANNSSTSSVVTVTALAAPTVGLSLQGNYYVAPAYIDLYATAAAASGQTLSKVELYNGSTLIATLTTPPFNYTWGNVSAGTYTLTAKATDSDGGTMTSTPVSVTVGAAPTLSVASGLDGSTVSDNVIQLTGALQTPPNSAVSVNGLLGVISSDGHFLINNVPLVAGSNALPVTVTTVDGQAATQTITVTRSGAAPFTVTSSASKAYPSTPIFFSANNNSGATVGRIDVSCANDGTVSMSFTSIDALAGSACVYVTPGISTARLNVYDQSSNLLYSTTQSVYVTTPQEIAGTVRSLFTNLVGRLKDGNPPLAMNLFMTQSQSKYNDIFNNLGSDAATAAAQFGQMSTFNLFGDTAEIVLLRNVNGSTSAFFVYVVLGDDGIWRIESM